MALRRLGPDAIPVGGATGIRTPNIRLAKAALCQLELWPRNGTKGDLDWLSIRFGRETWRFEAQDYRFTFVVDVRRTKSGILGESNDAFTIQHRTLCEPISQYVNADMNRSPTQGSPPWREKWSHARDKMPTLPPQFAPDIRAGFAVGCTSSARTARASGRSGWNPRRELCP